MFILAKHLTRYCSPRSVQYNKLEKNNEDPKHVPVVKVLNVDRTQSKMSLVIFGYHIYLIS